MVETNTTTIEAEVSVRDSGQIYVGSKAQEMLGVGYNDTISMTFKDKGPGGSDITVTGEINRSNCVQVGVELARSVWPEESSRYGSTEHVSAIIQDKGRTWYDNDDNSGTDRRWKKVSHLAAEVLP